MAFSALTLPGSCDSHLCLASRSPDEAAREEEHLLSSQVWRFRVQKACCRLQEEGGHFAASPDNRCVGAARDHISAGSREDGSQPSSENSGVEGEQLAPPRPPTRPPKGSATSQQHHPGDQPVNQSGPLGTPLKPHLNHGSNHHL